MKKFLLVAALVGAGALVTAAILFRGGGEDGATKGTGPSFERHAGEAAPEAVPGDATTLEGCGGLSCGERAPGASLSEAPGSSGGPIVLRPYPTGESPASGSGPAAEGAARLDPIDRLVPADTPIIIAGPETAPPAKGSGESLAAAAAGAPGSASEEPPSPPRAATSPSPRGDAPRSPAPKPVSLVPRVPLAASAPLPNVTLPPVPPRPAATAALLRRAVVPPEKLESGGAAARAAAGGAAPPLPRSPSPGAGGVEPRVSALPQRPGALAPGAPPVRPGTTARYLPWRGELSEVVDAEGTVLAHPRQMAAPAGGAGSQGEGSPAGLAERRESGAQGAARRARTIKEILDEAEPGVDHRGRYFVHRVRPNENLWVIVQAYLTAKYREIGVSLPADADELLPDGRSSPLGREIFEKEQQIYLYNFEKNLLGDDINYMRPYQYIVILKDILSAQLLLADRPAGALPSTQ
ncbi:MAG: hypothetical protein HYY96_07545 [Candidatus Tectomicrobia bacterium]|nr:hypothetical protein [Candidatus Tectomicrobia bacterium]